MIEVVVDGVIFQAKPTGGIARIFDEVLPRVCDLDPDVRVTLTTDAGSYPVSVPRHAQIEHRTVPDVARLLRPRRLWAPVLTPAREVTHRVWLGSGAGRIWHSTYYTRPSSWRGFRVVSVYDLIHERFAGDFHTPRDEAFRQLKRRCVAEADAVISISETTRDDLLERYDLDPGRVMVVPLAPGRAFRPLGRGAQQPSNGSRPFLLYVGPRGAYKNFRTLLTAYGEWSGNREVDLVVIGSDPWTPAEQSAMREMGVSGNVQLRTGVSDEALARLYNDAAGLVYPSLYEGFGIPLLEAMSCGCPVIASRIPSTLEVADEIPIYFEASDPADLRSALDRGLSEGRTSSRSEAGKVHAAGFTWESTALRTLQVYRSVLGCRI